MNITPCSADSGQTFLQRINPQLHSVNSCESRNWSNPWRVIYDQQLLIVQGAGVECSFDGGPSILCEPDSFIIKPAGLPHSSRQSGSGTITLRWVHFDWVYTEPPLPESAPRVCASPRALRPALVRSAPGFLPTGILHGPLSAPAELYKQFSRLQQNWICGTPAERAGCRAQFMEMLIRLLGDALDCFPQETGGDFSRQLALRTRAILNRMLESPKTARIPLKDAFKKLGYSYPHICRTFKEHSAMSPLSYFNNRRMEQAAIFLRETSLPINEIARNVGIDNPSYFSRLFVSHFGKSPQRFRDAP